MNSPMTQWTGLTSGNSSLCLALKFEKYCIKQELLPIVSEVAAFNSQPLLCHIIIDALIMNYFNDFICYFDVHK